MNKAVTHRLKLFIIMKENGYISMVMMMGLISGLSHSAGVADKLIIEELNRLHEVVDFDSCDLHFHFVTKK